MGIGKKILGVGDDVIAGGSKSIDNASNDIRSQLQAKKNQDLLDELKALGAPMVNKDGTPVSDHPSAVAKYHKKFKASLDKAPEEVAVGETKGAKRTRLAEEKRVRDADTKAQNKVKLEAQKQATAERKLAEAEETAARIAERKVAKEIRDADAAVAKQNTADNRLFQSTLGKRETAINNFNSTYTKAKEDNFISDKQFEMLGKHRDSIDEYDKVFSDFKVKDFTPDVGEYPQEFSYNKNAFDTNHYLPPEDFVRKPTVDGGEFYQEPRVDPKTVKPKTKTANGNTPPPKKPLTPEEEAVVTPEYPKPDTDTYAPEDTFDDTYTSVADQAAARDAAQVEAVSEIASASRQDPNNAAWGLDSDHSVFRKPLAETFSSAWKLAKFIGSDASRLISNAELGFKSSAAHYTAQMLSVGKSKLLGVERAIGQAIEFKAGDIFSAKKYAAKALAKADLYDRVTRRLFINESEFAKGKTLSMDGDPAVQAIIDEYVNDGFAISTLEKLQGSGIGTSLKGNPYFIPMTHTWELMVKKLESGEVTKRELYTMYGTQLKRMGIGLDGRDPAFVGQAFVKKVEYASQNKGVQNLQIPSSNDAAVDRLLDPHVSGRDDFGQRLDWDVTTKYKTAKGEISILDFVDKNFYENLTSYNAKASGLYGLANSGLMVKAIEGEFTEAQIKAINFAKGTEAPIPSFYTNVKSEAQLQRYFKTHLDTIIGDFDKNEAREFLDKVTHTQMGRATGEKLAPVFSAAATFVSFTRLAYSGLYNLVDIGTMANQVGLINTIGAIIQSLTPGKFMKVVGGKMSKEEAEESLAILLAKQKVGDNSTSNFVQFMGSDKYAGNKLFETIGFLGQHTTHVNLSEYVRKVQLFAIARVYDRELKALGSGAANQGRKSLTNHFKESGVPQSMIDGWGEAIRKYGRDTRTWAPEFHPNRLEAELSGLMDTAVLKVTHGELPPGLAYSSVGKAIMPFMTAQLSLTNKLLANSLRKGAMPFLELLAYQAPFAVVAVYLKEVAMGRDPSDLTPQQMMFAVVSSLPAIGGAGLLANLLNPDGRGLNANSTLFGAVNAYYDLGTKLAEGEVSWKAVSGAIPLIGLNPVVNAVVNNAIEP